MGTATITPDLPSFRFSSDVVPAQDRVAALCEVVGRSLLRLDITPLSRDHFRSELQLQALPGLGVMRGSAVELRFDRPRHLIDNDDVVLALCLEGETRCSAIGREATIGPGDAALMGGGEGGFCDSIYSRFVSLRMPQSAVPSAVRPGDLICRRIPAGTPVLQLLRHYIQFLDDEQALASPDVQRLAVAHVHDLFAATLGATRDEAEIARGRGIRAARLRAIKQDIAAHIDDADLSVVAVAARHRCTRRYIHTLFEAEGTSFTEYVLSERLARAHRMLTDPLRTSEKIATIAYDAGFGDLSHFNRSFRRRYGAAPSDVRAGARQDGTGR
jgi:AraC-like DNA-binding protein